MTLVEDDLSAGADRRRDQIQLVGNDGGLVRESVAFGEEDQASFAERALHRQDLWPGAIQHFPVARFRKEGFVHVLRIAVAREFHFPCLFESPCISVGFGGEGGNHAAAPLGQQTKLRGLLRESLGPATEQQDGLARVGQELEWQKITADGQSRQSGKAFENQLGASRIAAQRGKFGIHVATRKFDPEQMDHAGQKARRNDDGQQLKRKPLHAATPRGARAAFIRSARLRNSSISSCPTVCRPYHARSNTATLPAKSSAPSGTSRVRRRISTSYSRLVLPA